MYKKWHNKNRLIITKNNTFSNDERISRPNGGVIFLPLLSVIMILFFMVLTQESFGQRILEEVIIDLEINRQSIPNSLWQLSEKSNIPISYSNNDFTNEAVSYSFKQKSVQYILKQLLTGLPLDAVFEDNQIKIYRKIIKNRTISGYIEDQKSGERLIGANIYITSLKKGTVSNEYGFFSLTLPANQSDVVISYLGYQPAKIALNSFKKEAQLISLLPSNTLAEIIITDKLNGTTKGRSQNNHFLLESSIDEFPTLGGETDILQLIQQTGGIQRNTDGFGGLHVRGGNADQNMVFLDGVAIYNPYHTLGLYSIFDTKIVKKVSFLKGRFPARYGGRISSVVDVRTKDGNNRKFQGEATVGLITSRLTLEGPLKKEKSAFIFSMRRSHIDPFLKAYINRKAKNTDTDRAFNYYFGDLIGKFNYSINRNNSIYFSFYKGGDNYKNAESIPDNITNQFPPISISEEQASNWGNTLGVFRWNHQISDKLFSNLTINYSKFQFSSNEKIINSELGSNINQLFEMRQNSSIITTEIKADFDFVPTPKHYLRCGIISRSNRFVPSILGGGGIFDAVLPAFEEPVYTSSFTIKTNEINFYVEDEFSLHSTVKLNVGVFNSMLFVKNRNYILIDPRINITWLPFKSHYFYLSANRMTQPLHVLQNFNTGLPNDLWVPATDKVGPQQAWVFDFGWKWQLDRQWSISSSFYFKDMKNLIDFNQNTNFFIGQNDFQIINWEENVTIGRGEAKGIEINLVKERGRFKTNLAYTLARINRQFPNINNGFPFPFKLDHRHSINVMGIYKINEQLSCTTSWNFNTGNRTNIPLSRWAYHPSFPIPIVDYGAKNSFQLPAYHRLDISLQYKKKMDWGKWNLSIGVNNVYNRRNIFNVREGIAPGKYSVVSLIPILPYFSFSIAL